MTTKILLIVLSLSFISCATKKIEKVTEINNDQLNEKFMNSISFNQKN